jgi:hypothetical protein
VLLDLRLLLDLPLGDLRRTGDAVVESGDVEAALGCRERFSVNPCATLLNAPAACPTLRATAFKKGSFRTDLNVIWKPPGHSLLLPKMKSRRMAGTSNTALKRQLGGATLTVAILILIVGLVLTALLGLVLAGLTALLALLLLTGLTAVLALSVLTRLTALLALIALFIHIVCHKYVLLKKRETCHAFEI